MKEKSDEYWKKKLTPEQYRILRGKGTETPFTGELLHKSHKGVYKCAACDEVLFSSDTKYDSGSGWPAFYDAVDSKKIKLEDDYDHGMYRIEVKCANCDSHLGHVFDESSNPTGKYYCINSACLSFDPEETPKKDK